MHANSTIVGRLTGDPERIEGNKSDFVVFDLAVNRYSHEERSEVTDYYEIITFSRVDDHMKNLHKGTLIAASGEQRIRTFEKNDGSEGKSVQIAARDINYIDNYGAESNSSGGTEDDYLDDEPVDDELEDEWNDWDDDLDDVDENEDEDVPF
jgi:single-stranded DNA-binding protein